MKKKEQGTEKKQKWNFIIHYIRDILLFILIVFSIFWFMTTKIDNQKKEKKIEEIEKEYYTIDEIVGVDCAKVSTINSSMGAVSDKQEYSDVDRILDKKFKPCENSIDFKEGALYVTYTFYTVDSNGNDCILFWGRQDIVNNTWSFSQTENFSDLYQTI